MSVHKKLMQARIELQAMPLKKSGVNKFAGYNYFELGDFLPPVQELFHKLGLCGVVSYNNEYAQLCITDVDDNSVVVITSPMAEANLKGTHPIQNLGAVETYQRRYLWMTALEIVENDVLDATTGSVEPAKAKPAPAAKPAAPAPKPAPEPTGKPPAKMEGREGEWQLKVSAKPDTDIAVWAGLVDDATTIMLEVVKEKDDVMNIFKANRNIYDTLKIEAEATYKVVMDKFTAAKKSFEGAE